MKRAVILSLVCCLPVPVLAEDAGLPPAARHCVEALLSGQDLQTAAMEPTTPLDAGRPKTNPRADLFMVPDDGVVFARFDLSGRRACTVFPQGDAPAWPMDMIDAAFDEIGMVPAPECSSDDAVIWFSTNLNSLGVAVTAAVVLEEGQVREITAFETQNLSKAEDCADAGRN